MSIKSKLVIVGLSGGVDSSVAALRLLQEGFQVEGLFMKNWDEEDEDTHCPAAEDLTYAQKVCDQLQIPLHTVNFSNIYWDNVFEHFLAEYRSGRTPNPDVLCNREIKFKTFLNYALQLGADYIATGHYAQIFFDTASHDYKLYKGIDVNKDQSYFLYMIEQKALAKSLFPIGHLEKPKVRKIAKEAGLPTYQRKDSTGICFIGKRKFKDFLRQYMPAASGNIETVDHSVVGQHDGLMYYTLGQRQGLKIGGQRHAANAPWYVVGKDLERNVLTIAQGKDHPLLYKSTLQAEQLHWIASIPKIPFTGTAKIRYRQADEPCTIQRLEKDHCEVSFARPQRAITPGQSIVFYQENICLGGGIIL